MQLYRGYVRLEHDALENLVDSHRAVLSAARSGRRAFVAAVGDHVK